MARDHCHPPEIDAEEVVRFGVSMSTRLLERFDGLIAAKGYTNRSEAIRDLLREKLSTDKLNDPSAKAVAAVNLVYNHHSTKLMQKLASLQHSHLLETVCSTHIHLDSHDCLEMIVLKGRVSEINKVAESFLSQKGVKQGKINLISVE